MRPAALLARVHFSPFVQAATISDSEDIMARTLKEFAESYLQDVVWDNEVQGTCECPNAGQHSPGTGTRCKFYINYGFLALHCFHDHCLDSINTEHNKELIRLGGFEGTRQVKRWTAAQTKIYRICKRFKVIASKQIAPALLKGNPITAEDWIKSSPVAIPEDGLAQWRLLVGRLWKPDDLIWTGELWQSGKPEYKRNFKTAKEWGETECGPLGEQMSVAAFYPNWKAVYKEFRWVQSDERAGNFLRTKECAQHGAGCSGYTLIESDEIERERFAIIQRWLDGRNGLRLCAVIDSGGKSFHGLLWGLRQAGLFRQMELRALLGGLGADRQALNHLTARAPGQTRYDHNGSPVGFQRLLYLNPPPNL